MTKGAIFLDKFKIHRNDRQSVIGKSKHGGVIIGIKHEILHYCIPSIFNDCLIVKLLIKNPVIIACIYCAPKGSEYRWSPKTLMSFLYIIRQKQIAINVRNVMITGDINFAQTYWPTLISSDEDEQAFLDALAELNFEQMITGKKVQLDVILCNHPGLLTLVKIDNRLTSLYKTDHPPYHAKLNLILENDYIREKEVNERNGFQEFSFSKANWDEINQYINENPFNPYCYSNVDLMTKLCYTWLLNIIEKHIPRKT